MTTQAVLIIDPDLVDTAFMKCLYLAEEVKDLAPGEVPEGAVVVEGIMTKVGFHPERLEDWREQVTEWLEALPRAFRQDVGGGTSFLQACNQENGVQWTGLHQRMDQLFILGMALGLAQCLIPREMKAFPGGMPYYVVKVPS